jgi:hypothetical protein
MFQDFFFSQMLSPTKRTVTVRSETKIQMCQRYDVRRYEREYDH